MIMDWLLVWIGRVAGLIGLVVAAVALVARLTGAFWVVGFQVGTIFMAGIAGLTLGCFCMLVVLTRSRQR
jgi:hypothetical protein